MENNTTHHEGEKNTLMAVLAYLGILILVPFLTDAKKDPFVKFHLKQGVALIIVEVVGGFIGAIPILGWLIGWIIWLAILVLAIIGIMNASSGKEKELPFVGGFAKNLNF
jgi:uncharacterized membrane protein